MSELVDNEIDAIKAVLAALTPLSEKARASVLEYVSRRLDLAPPQQSPQPAAAVLPASGAGAPLEGVHIKAFKEQKKPRSANEMAALVAYYLGNVAPRDQRKSTINQKDVESQFKIGEFPLPQSVRQTLPNAKNAGYFDLAGDGEYKLNAVGHNLVAHSMPRGAGKSGGRVGRKQRPVARKKAKK